ncbi:MAG: DUF1217 domain-containing protein [Hyphomonadaceae bacterium]|nr:DUF1217 domain-containing protein [Hyphomonadaceae bacterium]
MTSTYLAYRMYAQDLAKSMVRTASRVDIAREQKYYEENIGKVKSVDDLLNNRRLFAYAMKAYGLEDMTYAKAFMRKVLQSDLNDPKSFARQLVDPRYLTLAKAFAFTSDGTVRANLPSVQNEFQQDDTTGLYSERRVRKGTASAAETDYYRTKIATLTSVDELIADERLLAYALTAYRLDPTIASTTTIRNVLTSDLSDPNSAANRLGDARYARLAAAFGFQADGSVASGSEAQSAARLNDTIFAYYEASGSDASPAAAAFKTRYYTDTIAGVTSVDELLNNDRLYTYALTAYGLDPNLQPKDKIRQVLLSDLSDPSSFANGLDRRFRTLAAAFNFAADGTIRGSEGVQSSDQRESTTELFLTNYDNAAVDAETVATSFYRNRINLLTSVDALIGNPVLYNYALEAFGLDPRVESKNKIRMVLTSDLSNPTSFVNLQSDQRYRDFAAAFNFAPDGSVLQPREAQTETDILATVRLYNTRVGPAASDQARAVEENTYYSETISRVRSLDDLLEDDRLVTYVLKAFGFEGERVSKDTLRNVLTSDPTDKNSFVSKLADSRFRDLAAAFNFTPNGEISRAGAQQVQTKSSLLKTIDLHVRQAMESEAGTHSEGVRLALYFQRKAADIVSPFNILADKALFEVVRTALSLPTGMAQVDLDTQAAMITKRLNLADLKDPAKVSKLLARFSALYDLNNGPSPSASAASVILGGGQSGIGTDMGLLQSLQRVTMGRL